MGQKVNPIIFRLKHKTNWKYKYFEKKSTEHAVCNFKDIEIRKFIQRFFDYNGLTIRELKLSYFNNDLHIFISYFSTLKTVSIIGNNNKDQQIKITARKINNNNGQVYSKLKKKTNKYLKYKEFNYKKRLQKNNKKIAFNKIKFISNSEKRVLKIRRIRFLNYYKNYLLTQKRKNISNIEKNSFLKRFFESLSQFTDNKTNISLTLNKLNFSIKQDLTKKKLKILKKKLIKLRKYKQNEFFKEGVNILFLATTNKNSAKLLSQFIATQLKKLKRHNFFLRFIKNTLILLNNKTFSKLEGMKIKIKGRFNRAPRARHKIIEIGNGVPALTISSNIDYAETTAFTQNGTFGVKVWICEKN